MNEVTIWETKEVPVNFDHLDPNDRFHDWQRTAKAQLEHAANMTLNDWIGVDEDGHPNDDFLGVEYIISNSGEYRHVILLCAFGGPNCYLYTEKCEYHLYWAGTKWHVAIDTKICQAIDEYFEQMWETFQ